MIKHFIKNSHCVLCKNWRTDSSIWLGMFCLKKFFAVGLREIFALTRPTQPHNCALLFLHKWIYCVSASEGIQKSVNLFFLQISRGSPRSDEKTLGCFLSKTVIVIYARIGRQMTAWLGIFCFKCLRLGWEIFALTRLTQPHDFALLFLHKWTYCVSASRCSCF